MHDERQEHGEQLPPGMFHDSLPSSTEPRWPTTWERPQDQLGMKDETAVLNSYQVEIPFCMEQERVRIAAQAGTTLDKLRIKQHAGATGHQNRVVQMQLEGDIRGSVLSEAVPACV
jgi:hypothetical protein